eukprot:gene3950-245_t
MSAAEEAAALSKAHKKWMIDCLRESEGNACSYEKIVEVGEEKQCDTVGAMLKLLKRDGDEIITLKDAATVDTYYAGLG